MGFHVFINFRGEDTRNTFVVPLHEALHHRGIHVFLDSKDLWKGEDIGSTLFREIKCSKLSIVVLSKRYVESTWCLNELTQILECHRTAGQIIFPIFYQVSPSNVKNQTGSFEISSDKHGNEKSETLEKWKDTLRAIGNMSGWVVNNGDDQSKLVADVTQEAWFRLSIIPMIDVKHPVGLESRVASVLRLISKTSTTNSKDIQFVGICGQGGIGKTTIATAVYNCISKNFSKSCFIGDVKEKASQSNGIVCLQEQLIYGMFHEEKKLCSSQEGSRLINERLQHMKTLLILDDVGNRTELSALAGDQSWFGSESRIIVTSRDQSVLNGVPKNIRSIFEPDELNAEESLRLFSLNAFSTNEPPKEYKDVSICIVNTAAGLPLTLEVLGCDLTMIEDKEVWKSKLRILKQLPTNSVYERLKTTLEDLGPIEKSMFLDAACFFIGWEVETILSIWEACGFEPVYRMEVLKRKSLFKFKKVNDSFEDCEKEVLWIHDQLRDMGQRIAYNHRPEKPDFHTRLWTYKNFFEGYKGNEIVEGISLKDDQWRSFSSGERCIRTKDLEKMRELRLLQVDGATFKGSFDHLPSQLRWLRWHFCPLEKLDADYCHEELVVLDLSFGKCTQVFNKWPKKRQFRHLKVLQLYGNYRLFETPDFSGFPHLEELDLGSCGELVDLHESIGELQKLVYLNLSSCGRLKILPNSISRLKSLKKFILRNCRSLEELPNNIGRLSSLQRLDLFYCNSLKELPSCIGDLKESLTELSLEGMSMKIEALPDGVGLLNKLEILNLSDKPKLMHLPRSMVNMTSLRSLKLGGCHKLLQIPKMPPSLVEFRVEDTYIENLPVMQNTKNLELIMVKHCRVKVEIFRGFAKTSRIGSEYNKLIRKLGTSCCVVTVTDQSGLTEPILNDNIPICSTQIWIPVQQKRDENDFPCFLIPDDDDGEVGSNGRLVMHLSMDVYPAALQHISVYVESWIHRKDVKIKCSIRLVIEGTIISEQSGGHIEFIHEFQGFDWFGVQLEGGNAIQIAGLDLDPASMGGHSYCGRNKMGYNVRTMNLFLMKERQSMFGDQLQYYGDGEFLEIVRCLRTTEDEDISEPSLKEEE